MDKYYTNTVGRFLKADIIPGKGIGEIHLGWNVDELLAYLKLLNLEYEIEDRANCYVLITAFAKFWVSKEAEVVTQILVFGEFKGKFGECIGIGSTLNDVKMHVGIWKEELNVYIVPQFPGICFELKDIDDVEEEWDVEKTPIEFISVFQS